MHNPLKTFCRAVITGRCFACVLRRGQCIIDMFLLDTCRVGSACLAEFKHMLSRDQTYAAHGEAQRAYKDGKEQFEGKASCTHTDISIVGAKKQGNEDNHVEASQRSDPLRRPATCDILSHSGTVTYRYCYETWLNAGYVHNLGAIWLCKKGECRQMP